MTSFPTSPADERIFRERSDPGVGTYLAQTLSVRGPGMTELLAFGELGVRHIIGLEAADHILFVLALAAIYRWRDWRSMLVVISAFTAGHSLTLALAVSDVLVAPASLVEFLIPVTIVLTGVENIAGRSRDAASGWSRGRPLLAGLFGLVHGAGFAGYLRSVFIEDLALPLVGFNLGIECAQLAVLAAALGGCALVDRMITLVPLDALRRAPLQIRVVSLSAVTSGVAMMWAWERWPL